MAHIIDGTNGDGADLSAELDTALDIALPSVILVTTKRSFPAKVAIDESVLWLRLTSTTSESFARRDARRNSSQRQSSGSILQACWMLTWPRQESAATAS